MSIFRYIPGGFGLLVLIAASGLALTLILIRRIPAERRQKATDRLLKVCLLGYTVAILAATLYGGGSSGGLNLVPFRGIQNELSNVNRELAFANIVGNVLMFVPIPILARLTWVGNWRLALACGAGLSLAIEAIQMATGRSADIDDILLNTAGAALGAIAGFAAEAIVLRRRKRLPTIAQASPAA